MTDNDGLMTDKDGSWEKILKKKTMSKISVKIFKCSNFDY